MWTAAHRFGVKQNDKIRQIDDFSRGFTNACTSTPDRVALDSTNEILAVAKAWIELMDQATKNEGRFWARWQNRQVTEHHMHSDVNKGEPKIERNLYRFGGCSQAVRGQGGPEKVCSDRSAEKWRDEVLCTECLGFWSSSQRAAFQLSSKSIKLPSPRERWERSNELL